MVRVITFLLLGLLLSACGESTRIEATTVDTIFYNGKIVTLDEQLSIASTVVVDDGRIVAIGDAQVASPYALIAAAISLAGYVALAYW